MQHFLIKQNGSITISTCLAPIYQKQSQQDLLMSQSFDFFFQAKNEYIIGHVPNTQNSILEFKEISSNFESI